MVQSNFITRFFERALSLKIDNSPEALQRRYCRRLPKRFNDVHIFLVPGKDFITGGVMSFHRLARLIAVLSNQRIKTFIVSVHDQPTHFRNSWFDSDWRVLAPSLFASHIERIERLTLHIPPVYLDAAKKCPLFEPEFLAKVGHLRPNVLNQNPWNMPEPSKLDWLRQYGELTQTVGFERVCTPGYAATFATPVHFFPNRGFPDEYESKTFAQKEKRVLLSPDKAKWRVGISSLLTRLGLAQVTFKTEHYNTYRALLSGSRYVVTLGEGFDGYFVEGFYSGSVVFAVYNHQFFPNDTYLDLKTVFETPEDLLAGIGPLIEEFEASPELFDAYAEIVAAKIASHYTLEEQKVALEQFENREYHQNVNLSR